MHHRSNNEQFRTRRLGNGEKIVNSAIGAGKIRLNCAWVDPGSVAASSHEATKSQTREPFIAPLIPKFL
jgi:hypothetical protein